MNAADSSAWIEYLTDGPNAAVFEHVVLDTKSLIVPTVCLYEVYKRIFQLRGILDARYAMSLMQRGTVAELTAPVAISAAELSLRQKVPFADSVILATARAYDATLWTQDDDFEGIEGVRYIPKRR